MHMQFFIFLPYILLCTNLFAAAIPIPRLPERIRGRGFELGVGVGVWRLGSLGLVIVAAATLVNALVTFGLSAA